MTRRINARYIHPSTLPNRRFAGPHSQKPARVAEQPFVTCLSSRAAQYEEYRIQGVHRMTLNYCSPQGNGVIGQCRRLAKMELQSLAQQEQEGHDPTKPHTV